MKYFNFTKQLAALAIVAIAFSACDKADEVDPIGDRGQTLVKLVKGGQPGESKFAIDFVPLPTDLVIGDVRRDVPNNTELNKTMNVTVIDDTAALRAFDPGIVYLPNTWYSISAATPKTGGDGGLFNMTMQPGEFAKQIVITIPDATVLDPSTTYGLAFTITAADANGTISYNRTVVSTIGAKNKYDGTYNLKGIHNRPTYQFFYEAEMDMITTGAASVIFYFKDAGSVGHPIATDANNTLSWYGPAIAPQVDFNPATNLATAIYNTGGATPIGMNNGANYPAPPDPANPSISRYDDATKTMYLYWRYNNNPDRAFFDTLYYLGPR